MDDPELLAWFRLALAWGCTVREAQARCTVAEFRMWQAFYRLEPWGEARADLRQAMTTHAVACVGRSLGKRGGRRPQVTDYVLDFEQAAGVRRAQTAEEMHAAFKRFADQHNARLPPDPGGGD